MNSRASVPAVIRHRQPGQTPLDFGGTLISLCLPEFLMRMHQVRGLPLPTDRDEDGSLVEEQIQCILGVDLRLVPYELPRAVLKHIDPPAYESSVKDRASCTAQWKDKPSVQARSVMTHFPLRDFSPEEMREADHPQPRLPYSAPQTAYLCETARGHRADAINPNQVSAVHMGSRRLKEKGGGYLCAPCHSLPGDGPVENILAMCTAQWKITAWGPA